MSSSKPSPRRGRPQSAIKISRKPTRGQRIGVAIRHLRELAKLDVLTASSRAGISREVWYRLERAAIDNIREGTVAKVAKVFRRSPDDLDDIGTDLCEKRKTAGASS